jgi:hypothetical protein
MTFDTNPRDDEPIDEQEYKKWEATQNAGSLQIKAEWMAGWNAATAQRDEEVRKLVEALIMKWLLEAEARCEWCRLKWDLGRHGCHYEPLPQGENADEFESVTVNCKAFGIRKRARELEAALAPFLPPAVPEPKGNAQ